MQSTAETGGPDSAGLVLNGHFPCCICCADASAIPDAVNLRVAATASDGDVSGAANAPAGAGVEDIAAYLQTGYWSWATDGSWTDGAVWDVSGDRTLTFDVSNISQAGAELARLAFDTWARTVDLVFVEQTGGADITFSDAEEGAFSFFDAVRLTPEGQPHTAVSAIVNISRSWLVVNGDTPDSFGFQTFLHEIGHAIGLGHPGPYNDVTTFAADAAFSLDSWQMSVMSYFDQGDAGVGTVSQLRTPMLADLVAVDGLYGLAANAAGDTVYGFNATAAGDVYDATRTDDRVAYTVHDTGGVDTLDYSGHGQDQVIDLRSSGISDIGGGRGNVLLGPTTRIERAIGGSGDDTIRIGAATVFVDGGSGHDTLDLSVLPDGFTLDPETGEGPALAGIEAVIGTGGDDRLTGDAGSTVFQGGRGDDAIDGRGGRDTASYDDAGGGVVVDLAAGTASDGWGGTDRLTGIERIIGSGKADTLSGSGGDDALLGGSGNDLLLGSAGNDTLVADGGTTGPGAPDDDELRGGSGDDTLFLSGGTDIGQGGAGNDWLSADAVSGADRFSLLGGDGDDKIFGSANADLLNGGSGADDITGGRGNDTVNAGAGDDVGRGEQGADSLLGSGGDDQLSGGPGHDTLKGGSGVDQLEGDNGHDSLMGGADDDTLVGGEGDDALRGASGDDMIEGGTGADALYGALGEDDLRGGDGADVLLAGAGDDFASGDGGDDDLAGADGDDDLRGGDGADVLTGAAGLDTLAGGGGRDVLSGGGDADLLRGGADDDQLSGQAGDDLLEGQQGNDLINGAMGIDRLDGGAGHDTLNGGGDDDTLTGGPGNDTLSGQAGLDTFVFDAAHAGADRVTGFADGETVRLEGFGYATVAAAVADFTQQGEDTVFVRGDVEIRFESASREVVVAGLQLGPLPEGAAGASPVRVGAHVDALHGVDLGLPETGVHDLGADDWDILA